MGGKARGKCFFCFAKTTFPCQVKDFDIENVAEEVKTVHIIQLQIKRNLTTGRLFFKQSACVVAPWGALRVFQGCHTMLALLEVQV